jgi:hypothetical protein
MNFKRGLIRIWVLITIAIVMLGGLASYRSIFDWFMFHEKIGIEIGTPQPSHFTISTTLLGLTKEEQKLVITRVINQFGFNKSEIANCLGLTTSLDRALESAKSSGAEKTVQTIEEYYRHFKADPADKDASTVKPLEAYALRGLLPEYSTITIEDFERNLNNFISDCQQSRSGQPPLELRLQLIESSAALGEMPADPDFFPIYVCLSVIALLWALLLSSFWVASGFK